MGDAKFHKELESYGLTPTRVGFDHHAENDETLARAYISWDRTGWNGWERPYVHVDDVVKIVGGGAVDYARGFYIRPREDDPAEVDEWPLVIIDDGAKAETYVDFTGGGLCWLLESDIRPDDYA